MKQKSPALSGLNEREQIFLSKYKGLSQIWCQLFLENYTLQGDFPDPDTPLFKHRLRSLAKTVKIVGSLALSSRVQRRLKAEIRFLYGRRLWRQMDEQQLTLWSENIPLTRMLS